MAFIDVGSFGVWGEGHTHATTGLPYNALTVKRHLDLYKKYFRHTLLAANDDFSNQGRGLETLYYARELGMTLRDDSILVSCGSQAYHHAYVACGLNRMVCHVLGLQRHAILIPHSKQGFPGARHLSGHAAQFLNQLADGPALGEVLSDGPHTLGGIGR